MFLASIGRRCLSLSFFIFIGLLSMFGTRKWFSVLMSFLSYLQAYLREYDHNDILLKAGFYPCTSICFIMRHYQNIAVHDKCLLYANNRYMDRTNQKLLKISRKNPKSNYSFYRTIQIEKNTKASMSKQPKISL